MTTWTDKAGRLLSVLPAKDGSPARLVIGSAGTEPLGCVAFWLDGEADLAEVAVAMHAANGQPAPLILERPEVDPEVSAELGPLGVWLSEGGDVVLGFGTAAVPLDGMALKLAALIAATAEAARSRKREPEPDPADVTRLAALVVASREKHGGWPLDEGDLAADLLRAGVNIDAVNLPGEGDGHG